VAQVLISLLQRQVVVRLMVAMALTLFTVELELMYYFTQPTLNCLTTLTC
jgi:hypothetical protein